MLEASLLHRESRVPLSVIESWDEVMDLVSGAAHAAYRTLVDDPRLVEYFRSSPPVEERSSIRFHRRRAHVGLARSY